MAYFCYIVHCANDTFYTGWTTDHAAGQRHNAGRGARYTRMNGPVELVYVEEVEDHSSALKREIQIKGYSHSRKAALAESFEMPPDFID